MLTVLFSILSYDIWFYFSHIMLHSRRLWRYHVLHHTKVEPTFMDTYVGHTLESALQGLGTFVPYLFCEFSAAELLVTLAILNVRGMLRHDSRCVFLIGNHHLLHHKYPNYNFGEYWLDTLFGTRIPNRGEYEHGLLYA